tara:strand:- start:8117 stop:8782 length:666 start_codon:yes stop_codon:yes gene_type:complete
MNNKVLYTAIFDNKDKVKIHDYINEDFDYMLFVDEATFEAQKNNIISSNWKVTVLPNSDNPRLAAKEIKILSHKHVSKYKVSIWVDGSFKQVGDLNDFLSMSEENFVVMKHPFKVCMYAEAAACGRLEKDNINVINRQVKRYLSEGYPENNGLNMGGILLRRKNLKVSLFNNKWWHEINKGSIRDQISFPYVEWKTGMNIESVELESTQQILANQPHLKND